MAADASGVRDAEVRGEHEAVVFCAMTEHAQTRLHGLFRVHAESAAPVRLVDLDRTVHHVTDEKSLILTA